MSIRDDLDRRHTDFISLRELLTDPCWNRENVSLQEAADWLTSQQDLPGLRERIDGLGVVFGDEAWLIKAQLILHFVVDTGELGDEYATGMPHPRDYDRFGFTRSAMLSFLEKHGIDLMRKDTDPTMLPGSASSAKEAGEDRVPQTAGEFALGDRARAPFQKQIAALALLLAKHSGRYKLGEKPNSNQVAEAVEEVLAALPDANATGVRKSTLRANIAEGIKLLGR